MSAENLIDGRAIAEKIHQETIERIAALRSRGVQPGLAFVRVGEDAASQVYVSMKERTSHRLGIFSTTQVLPEATSQSELIKLIAHLNADSRIHGILVQAPIPRHINSASVYSSVLPSKDVDGFHPVNMGKLMLGDGTGFVPCTPAGVHQLLIRSQITVEGMDVVILGRGNIVGKPLAALLVQKTRHANATVTVCHSQSRNIEAHCQRANIIIAALGVPHFVKATMVKPGATVIDVGVNRINDPSAKVGTRLVGDVEFESVQPIAGKITPNPGGVGPMTIAMLMANTVRAAELATT